MGTPLINHVSTINIIYYLLINIKTNIYNRNENGKLTHEDDYDFIVYDTAVDENDQIVLEDGTDLDLYIAAVLSGVTIETGFSGATTFDSVVTFDLLKV